MGKRVGAVEAVSIPTLVTFFSKHTLIIKLVFINQGRSNG